MYTLKEKVCWFALYSRLFVLALSALCNFLLPDHLANVFVSPRDFKDENESIGDFCVRHLFGGLIRWDSQYFLHIALYGYTYENCLAFFPLYPMLIRIMAWPLHYFTAGLLSLYSVYTISSVFVNVVCFVKSALVLHELSLRVLRDERLAYKAAILYCINPASIFFTAPYSETVFACLTFYGMLKSGCGSRSTFTVSCGLPFGLAAAARSNGVLNIGFIAHERLRHIINHLLPSLLKQSYGFNVKTFFMALFIVPVFVVSLIPFVATTVLSLAPFMVFQAYSYYKFCVPHNHNLPSFLVTYAETQGLVLPGTNASTQRLQDGTHWCNNTFPLAYSYIQSHYWDVGFLRYYQWNQIPNFLLAMPIIVIIFTQAYKFMKHNSQVCLSLGLLSSSLTSKKRKDKEGKSKMNSHHKDLMLYPAQMFVYVIHALFLTVFCALCIHVQVTTRLVLSASPVLYWFVAHIFTTTEQFENSPNIANIASHLSKIGYSKKDKAQLEIQNVETSENMYSHWKVFVLTQSPSTPSARLVRYYFLSYLLIGTLMFSNFYPWT